MNREETLERIGELTARAGRLDREYRERSEVVQRAYKAAVGLHVRPLIEAIDREDLRAHAVFGEHGYLYVTLGRVVVRFRNNQAPLPEAILIDKHALWTSSSGFNPVVLARRAAAIELEADALSDACEAAAVVGLQPELRRLEEECARLEAEIEQLPDLDVALPFASA